MFFVGCQATTPPITLHHNLSSSQVEVYVRGEHFTTYHYNDGSAETDYRRTPFLWPVRGEDGVGITRNFPMSPDRVEDPHHPHHRSLWFTFRSVNDYSYWLEEDIVTRKVETGVKDDYAYIRAHNDWLGLDGKRILREIQELRFRDQPASARLIELVVTFDARYRTVTFGDDYEGGIAARVRPELRGMFGGVLTNAHGDQTESEVYGKPAPWMSYSGKLDNHGHRGIAIFDHPDNFRQGYWHVRDFGLMALTPFAKRSAGGFEQDGTYVLDEGQTLTLRYAWFIFSGSLEHADLHAHQKEFASSTVQ